MLLTCPWPSNVFSFYRFFWTLFLLQVRWIRVLYSNFSTFTKDQEYLISLHGQPPNQKFDYVEGFVIVDEGLINNWRSSFFSPRNPVKISSFGTNGGVLYCLEVTKNYHESTADTIDQVYTPLYLHLELPIIFNYLFLYLSLEFLGTTPRAMNVNKSCHRRN